MIVPRPDRRTLLAGLGLAGAAPAAIEAPPLARPGFTSGSVDPRTFGARCDGQTDDTLAVQQAITACLAGRYARPLRLPGPCLISRSLFIDRPVDDMPDEFRIIGDGPAAGFVATAPIVVFDSRLAPSGKAAPTSEFVTFERVHFEARDGARATVASGQFLRMKFLNCYFLRIAALASVGYAQSWAFRSCAIRHWRGTFFDVAGNLFDCDWTGNLFEFGDDAIRSRQGGAYGARLVSNLFEGSGKFFQQAGGNALTIIGNYHEGNSGPDYVLTDIAAGGAARGVAMIGNQFTLLHDRPPVALGDVRGMASMGNYSNRTLFDMTATPAGRVASSGDYAEHGVFAPARPAKLAQPGRPAR